MKKILYILPLILLACEEPAPEKKEKHLTPQEQLTLSATKPPVAKNFDNNVARFSNKEGFVGVFEVGQMLALTIIDSAMMQKVAEKSEKAYELLEKDLVTTGAEAEGPLGQISYNNKPENFKFECLVLIKKIPSKEPVHSKIVVLEASNMLVYNHYGPYQDLYQSYAKIRALLTQKGLIQTAPVREFYMNNPNLVKDPSKWLTRILLPVAVNIQ